MNGQRSSELIADESKYFATKSDSCMTENEAANPSPVRCHDDFYKVDCITLAHRLIGQILVRILDNGKRIAGRIVETECYLGNDDKASHSYNGKRTPRNAAMFMKPGTAYVYITYGMYHCFNISSEGYGSAVLIRALEPVEGKDDLRQNRCAHSKRRDNNAALKDKDLCSGPSKLCQAMAINKSLDQHDMTDSGNLWIEKAEMVSTTNVVSCARIGIGPSAEEWRIKPLRFYELGNSYVSIRDKKAEAELLKTYLP